MELVGALVGALEGDEVGATNVTNKIKERNGRKAMNAVPCAVIISNLSV